jgi:hypothetical protein
MVALVKYLGSERLLVLRELGARRRRDRAPDWWGEELGAPKIRLTA